MRTTKFLLATLRETPTEAETISHQLMLRAGMIRKLATGIYTWLPLGLRVLKNVTDIVRQEMDASGALEVLMPAVQPAQLWHETDRWETFGKQLLKIYDRHNHEFCFGPTHEEVITDLVRKEIRSYKQLPLILYQIQTKFRDEIRPRFGVMRAREFLMKDAYSFHLDDASLQATYAVMAQTYHNIFTRLGLKFRAVLADSGNIGGQLSQEFHVLAESGEDVIAFCPTSDYAANLEKATSLAKPIANVALQPLQEVTAPVPATIKIIVVKGTTTPYVGLALRHDHQLNEVKVSNLPQVASPITIVDENPNLEISFPIIADREAMLNNFTYCSKTQQCFINVNWHRDLPEPLVADLRKVQVGDPSPDGQGTLQFMRGIEVGHIFQLGDKYSNAMRATVLDATGTAVALKMGCYGIGISRIVAAAIEQNHDERGIIWSPALAPFHIAIIPMSMHKSYRVREAAEKLYQELLSANYKVLLDDRKERAGILFADMDLIGIPHRIIISESGLDANTFEYKARGALNSQHISITDIHKFLKLQVAKV